MSKKLDQSKEDTAMSNKPEQKVEQTREEKKKLRRAAIENAGPLYLDDKYKREGFRQRLVSTSPGRLAQAKKQGYQIIEANDASVGSSLNDAHPTGASLEVEVGRKSPERHVWMEISEEDYEILREIEDDNARAMAEQIKSSVDGVIPQENRIGSISREN